MTKNLVWGGMAAAGLVALAAILDMAIGVPFGQFSLLVDILYLVAALVVLYMGFETVRDLK